MHKYTAQADDTLARLDELDELYFDKEEDELEALHFTEIELEALEDMDLNNLDKSFEEYLTKLATKAKEH